MKSSKIISLIVLFMGIPLAIFFLSDFPRRSSLMEALSVVTIISFFMMLLQFYLSRFNKSLDHQEKKSKVIGWHKVLGYVFVAILLLHPFFVVLPQYFNDGQTPLEALAVMLSAWRTYGVMMGMIAWALMLLIGLLSAFRHRLKMKYTSWRLLHGWMSIVFVVVASLHVINLGRHTNLLMDVVIALITAGALWLAFNTYFSPKKKKTL